MAAYQLYTPLGCANALTAGAEDCPITFRLWAARAAARRGWAAACSGDNGATTLGCGFTLLELSGTNGKSEWTTLEIENERLIRSSNE